MSLRARAAIVKSALNPRVKCELTSAPEPAEQDGNGDGGDAVEQRDESEDSESYPEGTLTFAGGTLLQFSDYVMALSEVVCNVRRRLVAEGISDEMADATATNILDGYVHGIFG